MANEKISAMPDYLTVNPGTYPADTAAFAIVDPTNNPGVSMQASFPDLYVSIFNDSFATNPLDAASGSGANGLDIFLVGGNGSDTGGNGGQFNVSTGAVAGGGNTGQVAIVSASLSTGNGNTGLVDIRSGDFGPTHTGATGAFSLGSGNHSGAAGNSGDFNLVTGSNAGSGNSGHISLTTGQNTGTGNSGDITLACGSTKNQTGGTVTIQAGDGGTATDGNINLTVFSSGATKGQITLNGIPTADPSITNAVFGLSGVLMQSESTFPASGTVLTGNGSTTAPSFQAASTAFVTRLTTQLGPVGNPNDTNEDTLLTFSLPAGKLASNGQAVRIVASGTFAIHAATTRNARLYFGATQIAIATTGGTAGVTGWKLEAIVTRLGASSQWSFGTAVYGPTNANVSATESTNASPGETLSGAVTIKVTGQTGSAQASDVVAEVMMVEWLP